MTIDTQKVAQILVECAETQILPRYKTLAADQIRTKSGPNDLVTQADIEAEHFLKKSLPGLYPGSVVIGEEGVSSGEVTLSALKTDKPVWVVDPVDGTYNFAHGKREFAVMVAFVHEGVTQAGWIYDVLGKGMAIAEKGQGAHLNGRQLKTFSPQNTIDYTGYISEFFYGKKNKERYFEASEHIKSTAFLRCSAHEYLNIAQGKDHFGFFNRLKPWDHLAGVLMVQEAGGYVQKFNGVPYLPSDESGGLIAASSEKVWHDTYELFAKGIV